jgi:hypothetical protein
MAEDDQHALLLDVQERYRDAGKHFGKARPHRPTKPCQYEGCSGWAWARGYCDNHYQKLKREGKLKATRIVGDPVARFHANYQVNPANGCWNGWGGFTRTGTGFCPWAARARKFGRIGSHGSYTGAESPKASPYSTTATIGSAAALTTCSSVMPRLTRAIAWRREDTRANLEQLVVS